MSDERIASLEEHVAHQAQAIEQLDEVVREQWREIERLRRDLRRFEERMDAAAEPEPVNRPPPHY